MIVIAFVFYISAVTMIDKKFNKLHIDTIAKLYFLVVIGLTFFKSSYKVAYFSLNPLNILNDFKDYFHQTFLILICNIFIYTPLGIYVSYKTRIHGSKLIFRFLIYIFIIELIQAISHRGIFDINDIITNTFGFYIGTLFNNIIKNFMGNHKIDDTL
jgi:glycopeptide antibiotics resistance protein